MPDRQMTRINHDFALAFDRNQWILQRRRTHKGRETWRSIAFIGSTKQCLYAAMIREGVPKADALRACAPLPEKFVDWLAKRNAIEAASAGVGVVEGQEVA